jgi:hypothetical protein
MVLLGPFADGFEPFGYKVETGGSLIIVSSEGDLDTGSGGTAATLKLLQHGNPICKTILSRLV